MEDVSEECHEEIDEDSMDLDVDENSCTYTFLRRYYKQDSTQFLKDKKEVIIVFKVLLSLIKLNF